MSLESAITSIVSKFAITDGGYALGTEEETQEMTNYLSQIIRSEIEPLYTQLQKEASATPEAASGLVKRTTGSNGYHLFTKQLREKLNEESGSVEAGKAKFKELGGNSWYSTQWRDLSESDRAEWLEKGRSQQTTSLVATKPKRASNIWGRFQTAYARDLKAKREAGEEVPVFSKTGEQQTACSALYKSMETKEEKLKFIEAHNA